MCAVHWSQKRCRKFTITAASDDNDQNNLMFCLFWYKTKLKVFILGKLSDYFSSFVFVTLKLQPRTCRVFRERYLNDRSQKSHGKRFSLSSPKFRAVGNKPKFFIAKFRRTYVSKRKFDEMALFVQRAILCLWPPTTKISVKGLFYK